MRLSARIVTVCLSLFLFSITLFTPFAYAQMQNPITSTPDILSSLDIPALAQGVVLGLLSTSTCVVGGIDYLHPKTSCFASEAKKEGLTTNNTFSGGLLGLGASGIAMTYTSPFHASDYFHYLSANFGIVKKAQATNGGGGFDQIAPVTKLWIAFRNLAYLLFVIVFIVIGFAIMLRAKIDPRTVMTIENQIPKLIIALILITFSFAIAGFVLDIMWVLAYLLINLFGNLDPQMQSQITPMTVAIQSNPFSWVSTLNNGPLGFLGIAQQAAGGVKDIVNVIAFDFFQNAGFLKVLFFTLLGMPLVISCIINTFLGGIAGVATAAPLFMINPVNGLANIFTNIVGGATASNGPQNFGACLDGGMATIVSTVIGAVAFLIFGIAMLVAIAKLWWQLIKAYALFIVFTIFGPLAIMSGVLPGSKTNFEYWLRHILAYTLVFPTAMGVFLLGKTLMDMYQAQGTTAPPLYGTSGATIAFLGPLLGFAVMMMAPQALSMVQDALNAPDPKYLSGIGQAIGVGAQGFSGLVRLPIERYTRREDQLRGLSEGRWRTWAMGLRVPFTGQTVRQLAGEQEPKVGR